MCKSSKWRRQVEEAFIPSYKYQSAIWKATNLLLFFRNLNSPLFFCYEASNAFVALGGVKVCEYEEDRGVRCICLS